jgi:hypothetical protein
MKRILVLSSIVAIMSSCSSIKQGANNDVVTLTGQVTEMGMTTFQYGTHLVKAKDKTYALKSSKLNLDKYLDKPVTLKGQKVAGYPLEGGPELIEVSEIIVK